MREKMWWDLLQPLISERPSFTTKEAVTPAMAVQDLVLGTRKAINLSLAALRTPTG